MESVVAESNNLDSDTVKIPTDFYILMSQRLHIQFQRAELQNNVKNLEYFYKNHKEFCEYYMNYTKIIYDWTNYRAYLNSKND
jgi:hypothetical protein